MARSSVGGQMSWRRVRPLGRGIAAKAGAEGPPTGRARPRPLGRDMRGPDLGPDQAGKLLGITFANGTRLQKTPATLTHDVREHRAELDVGGLKGLVGIRSRSCSKTI